jgi:hypothetical protein
LDVEVAREHDVFDAHDCSIEECGCS